MKSTTTPTNDGFYIDVSPELNSIFVRDKSGNILGSFVIAELVLAGILDRKRIYPKG